MLWWSTFTHSRPMSCPRSALLLQIISLFAAPVPGLETPRRTTTYHSVTAVCRTQSHNDKRQSASPSLSDTGLPSSSLTLKPWLMANLQDFKILILNFKKFKRTPIRENFHLYLFFQAHNCSFTFGIHLFSV